MVLHGGLSITHSKKFNACIKTPSKSTHTVN